ncbi:hypothetical protein AWC02_04960 [Mycolicibacter engbaekii]|uniref:propane 2-monooxygenase n=2 Tax=Mycolicibacter engbaekii TaxID=188915 RepID=A0A1X1U0P8_9MYCO|nr:hypothetical protein AWC02_04960 [Mycolicibacter engbaekii]
MKTGHMTLGTAYEDLTIFQQISPETDAVQGWPLHFPDGSPPLSPDSTALRSQNWYGFRDPNRSIYVDWVAEAHQNETALAYQLELLEKAVGSGGGDPDWLREGIAGVAAVLPYADRSYFRVLSRAQRLALSDTVTLALVFGAADALRHVEHAAAQRAGIESISGEVTFNAVEQAWTAGAGWQPFRAAVEQVLATSDWVEALIAVNVILEPLVGRFLRLGYLERGGRRYGDTYTIAATATWLQDRDRAGRWTFALIDHLLADPEYGAANRVILTDWVDRWEARASEAVAALLLHLGEFATAPDDLNEAWADVVHTYRREVGDRWATKLAVTGGL